MKLRSLCLRSLIAALFVSLLPLPLNAEEAGFQEVTGPCGLSFPEDHGAHPRFKTEWWYYTGSVESDAGEPFGFQLTFFRTALRPGTAEEGDALRSAWKSSQLFIAHAAVTDVNRKIHLSAETAAREALELAGVRAGNETVTVYTRAWKACIGPQDHRLAVESERFSLNLSLTPQKPPVLHGNGGYSRKGSSPERASCYYSFSRLAAGGKIRVGDRTWNVAGTAWMDHEFSTAPLEPGLAGWDWFSLQLSDRTELMVFFLRKADGEIHAASAGTFVDPSGETIGLTRRQLAVEVLDRWKSPDSNAVYPVRWRLSTSGPDLALRIRARIDNQEMDTRQTTGVVYWEGSVTAEGTASGRPVSGTGYVEMTGYGQPFDAPM
ncbi:MAG: carotenoid 1,2-hydratase [Desulfobacterales bacterium]|nr:carotenoid 1,2-hydratase [Desulfobacterales bacterium]